MVSTRGSNIKFAEGEKVLCYEPDPAKTKVLYDSKVLNIEYKKDKNGKVKPRYLIHFQGWSSTWDRLVTEDLILKDTDENRILQKDLASKAQLIARGGNLYRRERGSRRRSRGRNSVITNGGTTMSQGSDSDGSDNEDTRPIILLPLPESLKRVLEYDELVITTQNKVLNLPAEPNIITILESFLKDYAQKLMSQVCAKKQLTQISKTCSTSLTVDEYSRKMNLCREVVDGVRLFVDFSLPKVLLYQQEKSQYQEAITKGIQREYKYNPNLKIKVEEEDDEVDEGLGPSPTKKLLLDLPPPSPAPGNMSSTEVGERRRTLRSHLIHTSPSFSPTYSTSSSGNSMHTSGLNIPLPPSTSSNNSLVSSNSTGASTSANAGSGSSTSNGGASSSTSHLQSRTAPSNNDVSSSTHRHSLRRLSNDAKLVAAASANASSTALTEHNGGVFIKIEGVSRLVSAREHEVLDKILSWSLVPDKVKLRKPPLPAVIYGATHLIRALIRLPDLIQKADYSEGKTKIVMDLLNCMLKYLDDRQELFGEDQYIENNFKSSLLSSSVTANPVSNENADTLNPLLFSSSASAVNKQTD